VGAAKTVHEVRQARCLPHPIKNFLKKALPRCFNRACDLYRRPVDRWGVAEGIRQASECSMIRGSHNQLRISWLWLAGQGCSNTSGPRLHRRGGGCLRWACSIRAGNEMQRSRTWCGCLWGACATYLLAQHLMLTRNPSLRSFSGTYDRPGAKKGPITALSFSYTGSSTYPLLVEHRLYGSSRSVLSAGSGRDRGWLLCDVAIRCFAAPIARKRAPTYKQRASLVQRRPP
jgi:hypothetical protein